MITFKPFRFWSQKVLPLTYDDSLSYYEVLGKLTSKVNEIISNLDPAIRNVIEDMGLSGTVRYENVYNVKDYGAIGDGITDDLEAIQTVLNTCEEQGGGVVYIPEGKFLVSKCLIVGNNCSLIGGGYSSEIYNNDHAPFWGTAIAVVGSNSTVANLRVNYYDASNVPIAYGPAWGAIGITNCEYEDAINHRRGASMPAISDIVIRNIWTDGYYAVQCEPVSTIKRVTYKDIYAPNSMVSITGGTVYNNSYGYLSDVTIENVFCCYLRIQGGGYFDNIIVNNIHCAYCLLSSQGINASNIDIDTTSTNAFNGVSTFFTDKASLMIYGSGTGKPISISNCHVNAEDNEAYGIKCVSGSGIVLMNNVVSENATTANISVIQAVIVYATNCRFDISDSVLSNSVYGVMVNSVINTTETSDTTAFALYRNIPITYTTEADTYHSKLPVVCYKNGQVFYLTGSLTNDTNWTEGQTILTTAVAPTHIVYGIGVMEGDNERICSVIWNTDGTVTINSLTTAVTGYSNVNFQIIGM